MEYGSEDADRLGSIKQLRRFVIFVYIIKCNEYANFNKNRIK
jgi:hypothetical protein